ncbi:MAG: MFS transporter [Nanoarchaeota archaeon]|nr:MFS transporter [Nanoarchaeota archaeon]
MSDYKHEYAILFLNTVFGALTGFFLPVYLKSINITGWQVGVLLAVSPLVTFLASFPIGMINDKINSKILVMISMVLTASYYFGLAFVKGFWVLALFSVVYGVSVNLFQISLNSLVMKRVSHAGKGRVLGTYVLFNGLGCSIGLFSGGSLLKALDFQIVFIITGISFLALSLYSLLLPLTETVAVKAREYVNDIKSRKVLWLAVIYFLLAFHWGPEKTSVSLFLKEDVGLNVAQIGASMGVALIFLGLGGYLFGKLYDKGLNLKKIVAFGLLMSAAGNIGWYFTINPLMVILFRIVHEIGDGAFAVFVFLAITDIFHKSRVGGNSAFISTIGVLGYVTGTVLSGGLGQVFGNAFPILVSGLLSLAGLLAVPKLDFSAGEQKNLY